MISLRDYLKYDPWEAVIARINDEYQTELEAFSTKLASIEPMGGTLTKIVITPNQVTDDPLNTMPPIVRTTYTYDRIDLASFFLGGTVKALSGMTLPTNTFEVLEVVGEFNDIVFTLNDFMHYEYDEYDKIYTLTANEKSLRFVGSVRFKLVNTNKRLLDNLGPKIEFPDANDFPLGASGQKIVGQYQTCGYDFTVERDYLKSVSKVGVWPSGKKLAAIIGNVTGIGWVCTKDKADWNIAYQVTNNLGTVKVIYNGIVLPRYSPRTDILNVLVLQLGTLSNNVDGYLLLHYN